MPDVVSVVLLKLLLVNISLLAKLIFPKLERFVQSEPDPFEEKTQLQPTKMLKMVLVFDHCEESLHAGWEALSRVEI